MQLAGERGRMFFQDYHFVCRGSVKSVAGRPCTAFMSIGEVFSADMKVLISASSLSFPLQLCIPLASVEVSLSQYLEVLKDSDVCVV